jgi:phage tail tape-measure protein
MPDSSDYDRSSKVGTAGGTLAGAATGAALGSVGGPVGTVVGGVAGAVTGGAVGAAGDAVGAEATGSDSGRSSGYGSQSSMGDAARRYRSRSYEVGGSTTGSTSSGGQIDDMAARIENATERGIDADLDRDGDVGRRTNY